MAHRRRRIDQDSIESMISEGFGQGTLINYKPWLQVRDVPSSGVCSRVKGWTTGRVHEFFSQNELRYFYLLDWSMVVVDIREQYPLLPLSETLLLAKELGISHPANPRTQKPIAMTTDFAITVRQSVGVTQQARTIKPKETLSSTRTLEKLEIERCYWQRRGISWGIVTESEIPQTFASNVAWVHPFRDRDTLALSSQQIEAITQLLTQAVVGSSLPLATITTDCDERLGLQAGTSLCVVRHLIATRQWLVDMTQPLQTRAALFVRQLLTAPPNQGMGEVG